MFAPHFELISYRFSNALTFAKNKEDICQCFETCANDNTNKELVDLLVFVTSGINHFDHRQAIRETWGKELCQKNIVCVFLLGKTSNNSLRDLVEKEDATHKDIVQANFVDSYKNLTLKTVSMMKWISTYCSWTEFVLKIDDDMLINVESMLDFISYIRNESTVAIFGKVARGLKPHHEKNNKWFVPKYMYPHSTYPDFVYGPSYLIHGALARSIYETSLEEPYFLLEDVFITGIIASKLNITLKHQRKFSTKRNLKMSSIAFRRLITSHKYSPREIRLLWSKFHV
ncbi:beta-1,3-galactosyltransferase 1-like [Tachypleus tridentatus]|uniref:beta-1,3-galactosyltransferase 1-like n=1 Tax=Tachypleus tridentatus TaxID=6853 RepID=UPI003FD32B32